MFSDKGEHLNNFTNLINNFDYFIMYNDMPLFKVLENNCRKNKNFSLLVNSGLKLILENISEIDYNNINNLLENVSTSYSLQQINLESVNHKSLNVTNNYNYNNQENIYYETNQNLELKIKTLDLNNIKPTWNYLPRDNGEPLLLNNGIFDSVSLYNQNVKKLSTNQVNKDVLYKYKPNNFIMLFDKLDSNRVIPKQLNYGETIMGVDNINLSLTSSETSNLVAYNYKQLQTIEKRLKVFNTPAKVYFIYSGANLINTKPISQYDENGKLNPDYFDSPELVIENALRTYWLKPDKKHVMYLINNNVYEPILNNNMVLYNFKINEKNYYFDTLNNAKNKIMYIIKYNSFII